MFSHVTIGTNDLARAAPFYDAVMAALDVPPVGRDGTWLGYGVRCDAANPARSYLSVRLGAAAPEDAPGRHWCFKAPDRPAAEAFWLAGLAAGGADDGPPGVRPQYHPHY